jgi:hypothetical protein
MVAADDSGVRLTGKQEPDRPALVREEPGL